MANSPNSPEETWPVTWAAVEEAQLRDSLRLTPAQRLAWAEELLEFMQLAGATPAPTPVNKTLDEGQH